MGLGKSWGCAYFLQIILISLYIQGDSTGSSMAVLSNTSQISGSLVGIPIFDMAPAYWAPPYKCIDCLKESQACMCATCSSPYVMNLYTESRIFLCHRCTVTAALSATAAMAAFEGPKIQAKKDDERQSSSSSKVNNEGGRMQQRMQRVHDKESKEGAGGSSKRARQEWEWAVSCFKSWPYDCNDLYGIGRPEKYCIAL